MSGTATDRNGIEQIYYNGLYWCNNFDRFWQLIGDGETILVERNSCYGNGKRSLCFFNKRDYRFSSMRYTMKNVFERDKYIFIEPETQNIFIEPGDNYEESDAEGKTEDHPKSL